MMVGDPSYQAHRCLAYYQEFNNVTEDDKKNTKILLNMPLLSQARINQVKIEYVYMEVHDHDHAHGNNHDNEAHSYKYSFDYDTNKIRSPQFQQYLSIDAS